MKSKPKSRAIVSRAAFLFVSVLFCFAAGATLFHPDSPLADHWHPMKVLDINDPVTPLTYWKLNQARDDPAMCLELLANGAAFERLDPKLETENCGITNRIELSSVNGSSMGNIETACATALTLTMWSEHSLATQAERHFGSSISKIRQAGSYNCRKMRTSSGSSGRWSAHATAQAIDVTGFDLADGQKIRLLSDWDDAGAKGEFLRAIADDACKWFGLTLTPNFNALHADHFHLQVSGRGTCR